MYQLFYLDKIPPIRPQPTRFQSQRKVAQGRRKSMLNKWKLLF